MKRLRVDVQAHQDVGIQTRSSEVCVGLILNQSLPI